MATRSIGSIGWSERANGAPYSRVYLIRSGASGALCFQQAHPFYQVGLARVDFEGAFVQHDGTVRTVQLFVDESHFRQRTDVLVIEGQRLLQARLGSLQIAGPTVEIGVLGVGCGQAR